MCQDLEASMKQGRWTSAPSSPRGKQAARFTHAGGRWRWSGGSRDCWTWLMSRWAKGSTCPPCWLEKLRNVGCSYLYSNGPYVSVENGIFCEGTQDCGGQLTACFTSRPAPFRAVCAASSWALPLLRWTKQVKICR